jgi:hypothetical protein
MKGNARVCKYMIELKDDSCEHVDMIMRERLIGEKVFCRKYEDKGVTSS